MLSRIAVRLSSVFLCAALLLFGCTQAEGKDTMESSAKPVICSMSECTEYTGCYYINGKRVTAKNAAILWHETLYLSLEPLQEMVSEQFLYIDEQGIHIRHALITLDQAIRVDGTLYLPEPLLSKTYLHVNQDVLKAGGPIYLDTHLPLSVSYQHDRYEKTDKNRKSSRFFLRKCTILESGRRLWRGRGCVWVEDDWGKAYQYQKIEYGL